MMPRLLAGGWFLAEAFDRPALLLLIDATPLAGGGRAGWSAAFSDALGLFEKVQEVFLGGLAVGVLAASVLARDLELTFSIEVAAQTLTDPRFLPIRELRAGLEIEAEANPRAGLVHVLAARPRRSAEPVVDPGLEISDLEGIRHDAPW